MLYRKKPVKVHAFRFGHDEPPPWFADALAEDRIFRRTDGSITIRKLEGPLRCTKGSYVVQGIEDEIYPVKASVFTATYEPVQ